MAASQVSLPVLRSIAAPQMQLSKLSNTHVPPQPDLKQTAASVTSLDPSSRSVAPRAQVKGLPPPTGRDPLRTVHTHTLERDGSEQSVASRRMSTPSTRLSLGLAACVKPAHPIAQGWRSRTRFGVVQVTRRPSPIEGRPPSVSGRRSEPSFDVPTITRTQSA